MLKVSPPWIEEMHLITSEAIPITMSGGAIKKKKAVSKEAEQRAKVWEDFNLREADATFY